MGGVSPETCWASYKYEIKFWYIVASCWIFYVNYCIKWWQCMVGWGFPSTSTRALPFCPVFPSHSHACLMTHITWYTTHRDTTLSNPLCPLSWVQIFSSQPSSKEKSATISDSVLSNMHRTNSTNSCKSLVHDTTNKIHKLVHYTFILHHNEYSYTFRSAWYHHQGIKPKQCSIKPN